MVGSILFAWIQGYENFHLHIYYRRASKKAPCNYCSLVKFSLCLTRKQGDFKGESGCLSEVRWGFFFQAPLQLKCFFIHVEFILTSRVLLSLFGFFTMACSSFVNLGVIWIAMQRNGGMLFWNTDLLISLP